MRKLGVAVVGVGMLGQRHAENLRSRVADAELVAVVDSDGKRAAQVAEGLEVEHSYAHLADVLERKDVEAIVITTPSKFHAETIEAAARAGKHVFCEKPIALTLPQADAALAAVQKAGVQLQIGFMRRYDSGYANARRRIAAGEIGEPVIFKSVGRDQQPPPLSYFQGACNGTIFSDSGIHDFDLARWMMNDEIVSVHTFAGCMACPELAQFDDVDAVLINLRFARGGIGNIEAFRKAIYGYDIRTEILGTKAALQVGYLSQTPLRVLNSAGITHDVVNHWLVRFGDAYLDELRDFVRCVRAGIPASITGEDGRRALAVAVAAEQSYREARPVTVGTETGEA